MSQQESTKQFVSGMQIIEKTIIASLRDKGIPTSSQENYKWHRGQPFLPIPTNIELAITLNDGRLIEAKFDREYVEDCHSGINRPEVDSIIQRLVFDALKK